MGGICSRAHQDSIGDGHVWTRWTAVDVATVLEPGTPALLAAAGLAPS